MMNSFHNITPTLSLRTAFAKQPHSQRGIASAIVLPRNDIANVTARRTCEAVSLTAGDCFGDSAASQ